ncbi:unnamed protein product [Dibothriocephalus latus]|uniref:Uncharacterized protein n=1 Tax=Dibothriocephalus latus TaxID=60516 RepID=A0A3P7P6F0_DIBLA|nr:unnamed protein product [Dibothriocephalus latus]
MHCQREPQQQYKGEKSPPMTPNATFSDNGVQFTRPQASIQNQQALKATGILSQYSNQDVKMSDAGLLSRNQSLKSSPSGRSPLDGRDFVYQSPSGLDSPFAPPQTDPGVNDNIEPYQSFPTGCYYEQPSHQQIQFPPVDEDSRSQPFHSSQSTVVTLSSQGAERGSGSGGGLEPAYSDRQIFHAVPPLPPGSGALISTTQSFISASTQQSAPVINCNPQVVMRTRTVSSGRRVAMDAEVST